MISLSSRGTALRKAKDRLERLKRGDHYRSLDKYGQMGVAALSRATPTETGLTANSWYYRIIKDEKHVRIEWHNSNVVDGVPIAILIQYGHATGTGGYVQGQDFINPAMRPVFEFIRADVWKKVTA